MAKRFGAMNWLVVPLLRSPLRGLAGGRLALLTVTGRRTRRRYTFPTMCAEDSAGFVVVAAFADQKTWWKNLREAAPVTVEIGGRSVECLGTACIGDDAARGRALRRYLRRFPGIERSLGISREAATMDDATLGREATSCVVVELEPRTP